MVYMGLVITHLLHDALFIVIAQRTAQLVIVHGWPIFLDAPTPSNLKQQGSKEQWKHIPWAYTSTPSQELELYNMTALANDPFL
jgi:hypothetical protein